MKGRFCFVRVAALAAVLLFAAGAGLYAQESTAASHDRFYWGFGGSILFFPEDNGLKGDPMPILPAPQLFAGFRFWGPFSAELSLDVYTTHYGYDFELDRAVPYAIENRSARVWGFLTGVYGVYRSTLPDKIVLRAYAGPAFDLRAVFVAEDLNDVDFTGDERDPGVQTDAIREYFWGEARWFYPMAGTGVDFPVPVDIPIVGRILLGLDSRVWFPVYRLWSGEDLPAIEGWRFGFNVRVTFP